MPGPDRDDGVDEFQSIARLFAPLTDGAPEALGLTDDAAVIPARPGFDLVVSKDAMVAGVHFLPDDPLDLVARKLLRANLSDLAAKGADAYAYLLSAAWPPSCGWSERERFVAGLRHDQDAFGVRLIGGDTTGTPGPLTLSITILGWTPAGRMVRRSGALPGDRVFVSGTIGDGWLGLKAARGEDLDGLLADQVAWLADRYRLPQPRLALGHALRDLTSAALDVSDGLIADAGHLAAASGVAVALHLERLPLSDAASGWLDCQPDRNAGLAALAVGGDDYEIFCTARPDEAGQLAAAAQAAGVRLTEIGDIMAGQGVRADFEGKAVQFAHTGWRHG